MFQNEKPPFNQYWYNDLTFFPENNHLIDE